MEPREYNKPIRPTQQGSGHLFFYDPSHPLARSKGMVQYARHVVSVREGRWIGRNEIVRFRDGNRENCDPENLLLITRRKTEKTPEYNEHVTLICPQCGEPFEVPARLAKKRRFHSELCQQLGLRKFEIEPEVLAKLVWEMPTTHIAAKYHVSDKAVSKRCKLWGIAKPPPGYWAQRYAEEQRQVSRPIDDNEG
jgi:hypothetical protein